MVGGGMAQRKEANHAPVQFVESGVVDARGWRPLDVENTTASRPRLVDAVKEEVSAGAPGRYLGPKSCLSNGGTMTLVELFAAAILTLAPKLPAETATRYATDIENAVDADLELGIALVVTMGTEVRERHEEVERCICRPWECDRGTDGKPRALGLFQLHYYWWEGFSREEICASNTLSTILAAKEMRIHRASTRSWHRALRRHVGYGIDPKDRRVANRPRDFDRLLANARRSIALN